MKLNKIFEYVFVVIFVSLCFYISVEVISAIKNDRPVFLFNHSVSHVPTPSMETEIMAGDYVIYEKIEYDEVRENDIIIFKSQAKETKGLYIIHRVIEVCDGYLITQGDNNPLPDEEHITSDMVVGKYIKVIGMFSFLNQNKGLMIFFIIILLGGMLGCEFIKHYLKQKKEEQKVLEKETKEKMLEELKQSIIQEELQKIKNSKK